MLNTDKRPVRAALYCRMSVADMEDLEKVDRQEEDCRKVCDRLGWIAAEPFIDNNRSAWKRNRKRPRWDAMLEGVQAGRFDAIVVYHGDRLIRQPYDLEILLNLASEKGIRLASPTGTRNLDSADDRFILRIEAAQACRESDNISRRTKRAHESHRAKGQAVLGRTRAFGREIDGAIREDEAELIRSWAKRVIAGDSARSLWKELLVAEVPTVAGGKWRDKSIMQILRRPDLGGFVSYRGEVVGEAVNLQPILERPVWDALQAVLAAKAAREPSGPRPGKYLLSGTAVCCSCGAGMVVGHGGNGRRRYQCKNPLCTAPVSRAQDHLDEYVIGRVLRLLGDPRLWREVARSAEDGGAAAVELAGLEARRDETIRTFGRSKVMKPAELAGLLAVLNEEIEQVRARTAGEHPANVLEGLRGLERPGWDALALDRRKAVVRRLFEVTVLPSPRGPGFKPETVRVARRKIDADAGKGAGGGLELVVSGGGPAPE